MDLHRLEIWRPHKDLGFAVVCEDGLHSVLSKRDNMDESYLSENFTSRECDACIKWMSATIINIKSTRRSCFS